MARAARAIIIESDKMLVMHRSKYGSQYYTLVGGRVNENETVEQALVREVKEETGLDITAAQLVFTEDHPETHNDQYIFICEIAPHEHIAIQDSAEEALMNRLDANVHTPHWVRTNVFDTLPFRTPQLQAAIIDALENGFPDKPIKVA